MDSFRYPLEEIRERCDLVEVISAHVSLRKSGRTLKGLCPFHNEKTPSFHVDPERQTWKCFGCGEYGDVFSFVQKIDNQTFPEAVELLAKKFGITIERSERAAREYSEKERILRANNLACLFFRSMLEKSAKAKEYLARRELTQASIENYKLGYAPENWDSLLNYLTREKVSTADAVKAGLIRPRDNSTGFYDYFRDRLIFPIVDTSDRVLGFGGRVMGEGEPKYLNSPETPVFIKNRTLYGLNIARREIPKLDKVLIVEGYMDVIAAQEAGFVNTVATLGTALTEEHVTVIGRFTRNVVLSFDADSAGMKAALRSAPIFEREGFNIRILTMPKGEDPDSILRGGDSARFAELIEKAIPSADFKVKLVLMKYDLKTDEGKASALKEAALILAELDSEIERERLIRLLARYHPNFSSGTARAEEHLRAEVRQLKSRMKGKNSDRYAPRQPVENQKNRSVEKLTLLQRSERVILGKIIFQGVDVSKVFHTLMPNEFSDESSRALATALSNHHTQMGTINLEALRSEVAGGPAERLLADLMMMPDDSDLNHKLDELIGVIINLRKSEQRRRLDDLTRKIKEGLIKSGDEEFQEYLRLKRETQGAWRL